MKAVALVTICTFAAGVQAQAPIADRTLGPPTAVSTETFRNIAAVRELSDGRLLVVESSGMNAMMRKFMAAAMRAAGAKAAPDSQAANRPPAPGRVVLLSASLQGASTVGAAGTGALQYVEPGHLLAASADTTLLLDGGRSEILVIDPDGRIIGARSTPGVVLAIQGPTGIELDHQGRLLYVLRVQQIENLPTGMLIVTPDTAPIMAYDLATRSSAPVGEVHVAANTGQVSTGGAGPGGMQMRMKMTPFPTVDDWVVLDDGTVAILRGADLHVDWIASGGARRSTPPIPYVRVPVLQSDKDKYLKAMSPGVLDSMPMMPRNVSMANIAPDSFPAFKPPFVGRVAKPASDGTIWLPARIVSADTTSGYDVIGTDGLVRERIHLAKGERLVGFGKGVVYVAVTQSPQHNVVERIPLH